MFGVKFKQQIDDFKKDINHQLSVLKTELKSSIDVSSANSNQIYFQSSSIPPKDSETPDISEQIQRTLDKIGIKSAQEDDVYDYGVDPVHIEMYKIRLSLENLLRKYSDIDGKYQRRYSVSQLLNELRNYKQISKDILHGVTEVISVCNYAVHDEPLSNAQIAFVREFSPGLLKALKKELQNGL
ncbi:hypothetical protein [Aeromonas veronii]|uniref:hypothetical protein n=1 Tax=Aeromonas veronii TaxID=654 RepID=UPI003D2588C0